mgnify:CR=1 FL=1
MRCLEGVDETRTRGHLALGHARDTVHVVAQRESVGVKCGGLVQLVIQRDQFVIGMCDLSNEISNEEVPTFDCCHILKHSNFGGVTEFSPDIDFPR